MGARGTGLKRKCVECPTQSKLTQHFISCPHSPPHSRHPLPVGDPLSYLTHPFPICHLRGCWGQADIADGVIVPGWALQSAMTFPANTRQGTQAWQPCLSLCGQVLGEAELCLGKRDLPNSETGHSLVSGSGFPLELAAV